MVYLGQTRAALAVTLVLLTSWVIGKRRPCLPENNEYYNEHLGCHKCDMCPEGTEPDSTQQLPRYPEKGVLKCWPCRSCPPGKFSNTPNRHRCGPCRNCQTLLRNTDQPCNNKQNAVCGRCLPGYHDIYKLRYNSSLPQYDKACKPCSDADKDVPECAKTTLPTFHEEEDRTSHSTPLVLHKEAETMLGKRRPCLPENNEYYNEHLGCHECDRCPEGTEPDSTQQLPHDPEKGVLKCWPCRSCPPGKFSNTSDRHRCRSCRNCQTLLRNTDQPCNNKQNAVCGRCLPGYHDIYKLRYNSSLPQYDKACKPCSDADKDVPECAKTTLPTFHEEEDRTSHSTPLVLHKEVFAAIPYLMSILIVVLVIAIVVSLKRCFTNKRRRQQTLNWEVELATLCDTILGRNPPNLKDKGKPNSSYVPSEPTLMRANNGSQVPLLLAPDGPCGEEPEKSSVAPSKSDYRLIQQRIGKEWKDLARALVISDPDIEKLEMDNPDTRERIYQLLLLWERTCESEALLRQLCTALQSIGRHDVAIELLQSYSESS